MAKAIYILKLYLFQHQFNLTSKEKNSVKELALFVSLVYVRFWHEALLIIKVPLNDMQLLELLTKYLNRTVVKTAEDTLVDTFGTVSYTHLTLPTKRIV